MKRRIESSTAKIARRWTGTAGGLNRASRNNGATLPLLVMGAFAQPAIDTINAHVPIRSSKMKIFTIASTTGRWPLCGHSMACRRRTILRPYVAGLPARDRHHGESITTEAAEKRNGVREHFVGSAQS
ncbi:MAG: hypothetical protein ACREPN_07685 [Rudaea sp.]